MCLIPPVNRRTENLQVRGGWLVGKKRASIIQLDAEEEGSTSMSLRNPKKTLKGHRSQIRAKSTTRWIWRVELEFCKDQYRSLCVRPHKVTPTIETDGDSLWTGVTRARPRTGATWILLPFSVCSFPFWSWKLWKRRKMKEHSFRCWSFLSWVLAANSTT